MIWRGMTDEDRRRFGGFAADESPIVEASSPESGSPNEAAAALDLIAERVLGDLLRL